MKSPGSGAKLDLLTTEIFAVLYCAWFRSVYKELHADHETGAADNK